MITPPRSSRWFEPRLSPGGRLGFMLHRLSGLGLLLYLYLHLAVLAQLRQGASGWETFLRLVRSPLFYLLDAMLLFGFIFHGLNGLRLVLVESGRAVRWHKLLFWIVLAVSLLLTLLGMLGIALR